MTTELILHAGAEKATLEQVQAVVTPPPTASWQPIPHARMRELVLSALEPLGLKVARENHGLYREGARYFGVFDLTNGHEAKDYGLTIGLRNSHDKSFPAALALGSRVFVCDNLAFSGEVSIARRHTSRIEADLPRLVEIALARLTEVRNRQGLRIEAYKVAEISDGQAHDTLIRALDARIIPVTRLPAVLKEWRAPSHEDFKARTAWALFNCFTQVLKDSAPIQLPNRTLGLHGLMDGLAGLHLPASAAEAVAQAGIEDAEVLEDAPTLDQIWERDKR